VKTYFAKPVASLANLSLSCGNIFFPNVCSEAGCSRTREIAKVPSKDFPSWLSAPNLTEKSIVELVAETLMSPFL